MFANLSILRQINVSMEAFAGVSWDSAFVFHELAAIESNNRNFDLNLFS
jgi:DNA-binding cell septation regulator SpoVG